MKTEHLPEPNLSQLMSGETFPMSVAPSCVTDAGYIPYGELISSEESHIQIIFTDSVRNLYLADAKLDRNTCGSNKC
jgi:hypothetical protein